MKLKVAVMMIALAGILSVCTLQACAENETGSAHTTTVMVYMCGSDLESRFGAASKDVVEMMASGFDTEHTNLLLMIGGAEKWKTGFDSAHTAIAEVSGNGMKTVWRSDAPMNMADGDTLKSFLNYSYENYPAERSALIIWDHGGGPNEGVCYDELYTGDTLTLQELRDALSADLFRNKLNWIGFDACLMASVESAFTLSQYADYLIASQEVEPSKGWDYSFLRGLEHDANEVETGRRIIDRYFESNRNSNGVLTLSCVDLNQLWGVTGAIDRYFDALYPVLSDESFSLLSRERHQTRGFGRSEHNDIADYDLVDLLSLVRAYENEGISGKQVETAVEQAVVYSRSNIDGANGLSIYHPCYNRDSYTGKWAEDHRKLFAGMANNYEQFIERFGHVLTGKQLGDWSDLKTVRSVEENGDIRFSVSLSDKQAEYFEHGTLLFLSQIIGSEKVTPAFCSVWETPYLDLDENNTLSAVYPRKAVYVVDDVTGERLAGPIDYRITEDEELQVCVLFWDDDGILDEELLNTMYFCRITEGTNKLFVDRICAYNPVTKEYSNRMEIDEETISEGQYSSAVFFITAHMPTYKGEELLGFQDWHYYDTFAYDEFSIPRKWHFEIIDNFDEEENICAVFQISDTQSLRHSSSLSRVYPSRVVEYDVDGNFRDNENSGVVYSASVQQFLDSAVIDIEITLNEFPQNLYRLKADNLLINGTVQIDSLYSGSYRGEPVSITLTKNHLSGINEIDRIDIDYQMQDDAYQEIGNFRVCLVFSAPIICGETLKQPLAECDTEGLHWKLWRVEQMDTNEIALYYDITNCLDSEVGIEVYGVALEAYYRAAYSSLAVDPGKTVKADCTVSDYVNGIDANKHFSTRIDCPIALLGIDSFNRIRLFYKYENEAQLMSEKTAEFILPEGISYRPLFEPNQDISLTVLDKEGICLQLAEWHELQDEASNTGSVMIGLWIYNTADRQVSVSFSDFYFNDSFAGSVFSPFSFKDIEIPEGTSILKFFQIKEPQEINAVDLLSFDMEAEDIFKENVTVEASKARESK